MEVRHIVAAAANCPLLCSHLYRWLKDVDVYGACLITGLSAEKRAVHKVN